MTLFDELAIDALCGEMGRFTPGMLLDRKRHAFDWGVPVPRSEPKSRNVHVAQVATKLDYAAIRETYLRAARSP